MGGQRLDRAELRHRLSHIPAWIVDEFADVFEPAVLKGLKVAADRERKSRPDKQTGKPGSSDRTRRARRGQPPAEGDDA